MAEGNGTTTTRRDIRRLPVPLTDDQRRATDREIGELGVERKKALAEEEAAKELHKDKREHREELDEKIATLALQLGEGCELGDVEVLVTFDWSTNTVTEQRTDTLEVLATRAATIEERQEVMQLATPAAPGELRWRKRDGLLVAEVEGDGRYEIGGEGESRDCRFTLKHGASTEVALGVDVKTAKVKASEHARERAARASAPVVPLKPEAAPEAP
jgi:hypothetical protein